MTVGSVGAKLCGTYVDTIQLLDFYSDALILSGVSKDYDDKTIKHILALIGDDFVTVGKIGCITAEEYETEIVERVQMNRRRHQRQCNCLSPLSLRMQ